MSATADLDGLDAEIVHVRLKNTEPIRLALADRVLRIENFHLSGSGTDFSAHGSAQLAEPRALDVRLDGTVDMALVQTLNPKISARGMLAVNLSAAGTATNPVLQGRLEVKNTFISHNDFPSGLSDLNGVLLFDQSRLQIQNLNGTTGGGTIGLMGFGSYQHGVIQMDIAASAQGVRLRYPTGVSSTANATLRLSGSSNSALLSGDVLVTKLGVTPGFDFGAYLEKSKRTVSVTGPDTLESRLRLDIHVQTTSELQMQTAIAKLSGNGDLRIRGTADRPVAIGRVSANEGGEISFNGTKYRLERGEVTFSNPAKTEPIIDIQAATRVRDYDITVNISGNVAKSNGLKATWHSEPPLPEADVIALLALGQTREESAALQGSGSGFGGAASNLLITEALNATVSSRVQRLFGVSRIKIDPQGLTSETNVVRGPQVTIEQQVASNLTITYSTNVSVASQQIIQVEYNVTRNISIVALRDQNGVVSFDLKVRQRKR
jgi:translocation and assembly module TamB